MELFRNNLVIINYEGMKRCFLKKKEKKKNIYIYFSFSIFKFLFYNISNKEKWHDNFTMIVKIIKTY